VKDSPSRNPAAALRVCSRLDRRRSDVVELRRFDEVYSVGGDLGQTRRPDRQFE